MSSIVLTGIMSSIVSTGIMGSIVSTGIMVSIGFSIIRTVDIDSQQRQMEKEIPKTTMVEDMDMSFSAGNGL